ncbi:MAG: hypothetical protein Q9195_002008 [Heterodermia aff. obscurata]
MVGLVSLRPEDLPKINTTPDIYFIYNIVVQNIPLVTSLMMPQLLSLPTESSRPSTSDNESIYENVQNHYGRSAKNNDSSYGNTVASEFGYSKEDLKNAPLESNLGLSCGNPFAIANLREGETIVDLGSGAGFDVFQAAKKVGASGKAIGVDMNEEMLSKANDIKAKVEAHNVFFVKSRITKIELPNETANCIISNCVVNLVPTAEKQLVFNEMFRLLKPNGRVALSDILLKKDLPNELKNSVALYVGCISGASRMGEYEHHLRQAGFQDILIIPDRSDLNVYKTQGEDGTNLGCCGPTIKDDTKSECCGSKESKSTCNGNNGKAENDDKLAEIDLNEWAGSYKIYAVKPK